MDRDALSQFLRRQRERLTPQDVGMQAGPRRRTPGLRREEVAQLAGMSVDYYVRLEQRRGPQPSVQMLAALARALRLTDDQRDYLFRLADHTPPVRLGSTDHVRPGLQILLDQITDLPAMVVNDLGDILAANVLVVSLLDHYGSMQKRPGDFMRKWFLQPDVRQLHPPEDHDHQSRVRVADLRALSGKRPNDSVVRGLIAELQKGSEEFRSLWDEHEVAVKRAQDKRIVHPTLGSIELHCETMLTPDGDQKLILYTAEPGSEAAKQLELLKVVGRQEFVRLDD